MNNYIVNSYLKTGNCPNNFVVYNCEISLMIEFYNLIERYQCSCAPLLITLSNKDENYINSIACHYSQDFQKNIIARTYLISLMLKEFYSICSIPENNPHLSLPSEIQNCLSSYYSGDAEYIKQAHYPMPIELKWLYQHSNKKFEIVIFEDNITNMYLQNVINDLISARDPWTIKTFTNNSRFCTNTTTNGDILQSPHDYMNLDVNLFKDNVEDSK